MHRQNLSSCYSFTKEGNQCIFFFLSGNLPLRSNSTWVWTLDWKNSGHAPTVCRANTADDGAARFIATLSNVSTLGDEWEESLELNKVDRYWCSAQLLETPPGKRLEFAASCDNFTDILASNA
ncbi:hypothetical protein RB195_014996 [Necator americanus]|uniref:Uncharacterized protein n=1 Tax=Necator americanus TaxID=51031 RepID=A0ABR1E2N6_NECAM